MRNVANAALLVAYFDIRVMIFAVRHPSGGVHECHGFIIIFECVFFNQLALHHFPPTQLSEIGQNLRLGKGKGALLAGLAFVFGEIGLSRYKEGVAITLAKVTNKDTQTVVSALIKQAKRLPDELYKSLTWDRGKELADHLKKQKQNPSPKKQPVNNDKGTQQKTNNTVNKTNKTN